jgi:hypothetical protein
LPENQGHEEEGGQHNGQPFTGKPSAFLLFVPKEGRWLEMLQVQQGTGSKKDHRQQSDNETLAHRAPGHPKRGIGRDEVGQKERKPFLQPQAGRDAAGGPEDAQQQDDTEIEAHDKTVRSAKGFHGGHGFDTRPHEGRQYTLDADARQQKRKNPHQFEKKKQVVEKPLQAGIRAAEGIDTFLGGIRR